MFVNSISEPNSPRSKALVQNNNFENRMTALNKVYKMRDLYDNVYAEAIVKKKRPMLDVILVSKKI